MDKREGTKILVKLNNKELMSRYIINSENELEVDPIFDTFFNKPGREEDLFVKKIEDPQKDLNISLKKYMRNGKVESAQMQYDETPSIFNNFKIDLETAKNLIDFFRNNKESILKGELIPVSSFKGYKKLSKILVLSDIYVYIPGLIIEYCERKIKEIDEFDEE